MAGNVFREIYRRHPSFRRLEEMLAANSAEPVTIHGLTGSSRSIVMAGALSQQPTTHVVLLPDPGMAERLLDEEKARLEAAQAALSPEARKHALELAARVEAFQDTPDSSEALATIPKLHLKDLPTVNKVIPGEWLDNSIFFHDLPTNGVVYLELGFDMSGVSPELLPLVPLFGRALLEMGTDREDFADFLNRVARKTGRVVYAASSSAYGDTEVLPKTESMRPQPLSPYAMQKLAGEYYCSVFSHCYGLETVSLRFFNVFGPRQDPTSPYSGVLSIFLNCLIDQKSPTIFGDGEQSRDFTFVEDVAALCVKASNAPAEVVSGKVYNAGNGRSYTLNQTWRMLCQMAGLDIQPEYGEPRAGDVRDSLADTTAAVRDLGHAPRFSFEEGLKLTLDWYQQSRGE